MDLKTEFNKIISKYFIPTASGEYEPAKPEEEEKANKKSMVTQTSNSPTYMEKYKFHNEAKHYHIEESAFERHLKFTNAAIANMG